MLAEAPSKVMKLFFAVDVSPEMGEETLNAVNRALLEIREELVRLQEEGRVVLEMAVLAVGQKVEWHCRPTPAALLKPEPLAAGQGPARWAGAFRLLNKGLTRHDLMAAKGTALVPSLVFVAGGRPEEDPDALGKAVEELNENRWYGHFNRYVLLTKEEPVWDALAKKLAPGWMEENIRPTRESEQLTEAMKEAVLEIAWQAAHPIPWVSGRIDDRPLSTPLPVDLTVAEGGDDWMSGGYVPGIEFD